MALPPYLREFPVAVIHYRWSNKLMNIGPLNVPMHWPLPMSDIAFAYAWLTWNLKPQGDKYARRDMYVYGSKLGAGLAVSLALTSCRPHTGVAIRGVAAWDGIYDWTRFLPDHWDNQFYDNDGDGALEHKIGDHMAVIQKLKERAPGLFKSPENMFDAYASPLLQFSTPGLSVPETFHKTIYQEYEDKRIPLPASHEEEAMERLRQAHEEQYGFLDISDDERHTIHPDPGHESHTLRRLAAGSLPPPPVNLNFPTRGSLLEIPETLMLYTSPPEHLDVEPRVIPFSSPRPRLTPCDVDPSDVVHGPEPPPRKMPPRYREPLAMPNTFKSHAITLGNAMVRSINEFEVKSREKWREPPHEFEEYLERAQYRVIAAETGLQNDGSWSLSERGQELLLSWLKPRLLRTEQDDAELLQNSELSKVSPDAVISDGGEGSELLDSLLLDGTFNEQPEFFNIQDQLKGGESQGQEFLENNDDRIELPDMQVSSELPEESKDDNTIYTSGDSFEEVLDEAQTSDNPGNVLLNVHLLEENKVIEDEISEPKVDRLISPDQPLEPQFSLESTENIKVPRSRDLSDVMQNSLDESGYYGIGREDGFDILQTMWEQEINSKGGRGDKNGNPAEPFPPLQPDQPGNHGMVDHAKAFN
ncbi:uncharacterized protein BROUX77_001865 [Berkeleyomyces rouxiae]|uniref:uncharacterized protein n=1 Tax=Berkeleyomyces rouxiae TaxID=2035830 RepID=UPI003B75F5DB